MWVNLNSADLNPGQTFYRFDAFERIDIKSYGTGFYVTGCVSASGSVDVTLASEFATEDDARAWVLELINPTSVK